jgi:hypothetical protein
MPSPVGHLLAATAVYFAGTTPKRGSRLLLAGALIGGVLPDFDFVPGLLIGDFRAFHHGISHSVALALVYGAVVFAVTQWMDSRVAVRAAALATLAYVSHIMLVFVAVNEGTRGVPLLWPVIDERIGFNLRLFGHFRYTDFSDGIWSVLLWVNVTPVLRELLILGALVMLLQKGRMWQWFLTLPTRVTNRYQ